MEPTSRGRVERPLSRANTQPADPAGAETLEIMQAAPRYNRWQYRRIAPYLGRRVCEIGSGIGNISSLILESAPDLLVLTDTDAYYRTALHQQFGACPNVVVEELTLPDPSAGQRFARFDLDTVVALNVIEHIEDDVGALRSIASMLRGTGRAVILVPALPALFGSLDLALGHHRRYTRTSLTVQMQKAGFRVQQTFYFSLTGIVGWWLNARIRRVPRIPLGQLRNFDRLVPLLRTEDLVPLPFGQSVIAVGALGG